MCGNVPFDVFLCAYALGCIYHNPYFKSIFINNQTYSFSAFICASQQPNYSSIKINIFRSDWSSTTERVAVIFLLFHFSIFFTSLFSLFNFSQNQIKFRTTLDNFLAESVAAGRPEIKKKKKGNNHLSNFILLSIYLLWYIFSNFCSCCLPCPATQIKLYFICILWMKIKLCRCN